MLRRTLLWTWIGLLVFAAETSAQTPYRLPAQPESAPGRLPVVPNLSPRPGEGPQTPWRTDRRDGPERQPVAGFVDSLKGNDAVVEVYLGRGKILTTRASIARQEGLAVIAVSDPTILDFTVLPDSRMIRLTGRRVGVTDLNFVDATGATYSFAVHVLYDLDPLRMRLKQAFPDARVKVSQLREHVIVEGQVNSDAEETKVLDAIRFYLASEQSQRRTTERGLGPAPSSRTGDGDDAPPEDPRAGGEGDRNPDEGEGDDEGDGVAFEEAERPSSQVTFPVAQIVNLLTIPGPRQVMLKVQIAELNRTALRQIGADLAGTPGNNFLASVGGAFGSTTFEEGLSEVLFGNSVGTLVGIFDSGNFAIVMRALRQNNLASVLAEPNLVTLDGHEARFQSGGEFPVPVAQQGGGIGNNTVEFKDFGIQLAFQPHILDDGVIRLHVEPEVSNIAEEIGTTLILNGEPIPGLRTRNAATTVELREGQTLAIAGLLDREVNATTARIPFIGDLPYVGKFFGSSTHEVLEQELLVAVTPYFVSATEAGECDCLPGADIMEPNDLEFYLLQRIEGRTGRPHRSTLGWDDPYRHKTQMQVEQAFFVGPSGFAD